MFANKSCCQREHQTLCTLAKVLVARRPRAKGEGGSWVSPHRGHPMLRCQPRCSESWLQEPPTAQRRGQTPGRGQQCYSLSMNPTERTAESIDSGGKPLIEVGTFQITAIHCCWSRGKGGIRQVWGFPFVVVMPTSHSSKCTTQPLQLPRTQGLTPHVGDAQGTWRGSCRVVAFAPLDLHVGCDTSASPPVWEGRE